MKAPGFWQKSRTDSLMVRLLLPLADIYGRKLRQRLQLNPEYQSSLPVLCVGNAVAGGSGKTPVVQALVQLMQEHGRNPAILMRGYGGKEKGPLRVEPFMSASRCGDEALLHASVAPTIVSADRVQGAKLIETIPGITQIVMDDGLQNPSLKKGFSVLVVNGANPIGNGELFPAGPLRETMEEALRRVDAMVVLGEDKYDMATRFQFLLPIFKAKLQPLNGVGFTGKPVFAFAGIGHPEKFFDSLKECDAILMETKSFPDHFAYIPSDILPLIRRAQSVGAQIVTTRKDWVRLPDALKPQVAVLDVALEWQDKAAVAEFLRLKRLI